MSQRWKFHRVDSSGEAPGAVELGGRQPELPFVIDPHGVDSGEMRALDQSGSLARWRELKNTRLVRVADVEVANRADGGASGRTRVREGLAVRMQGGVTERRVEMKSVMAVRPRGYLFAGVLIILVITTL